MLIFSTFLSPRLTYIINTIFQGKANCTTDEWTFKNYTGEKINYSPQKFSPEELHIQPHSLLQETSIHIQDIEVFPWHELPVFFRTGGDIPFDFFAASFYLLTRYEEYLSHTKDLYGRYPHTESLAFKNHFLQFPLIDCWYKEIFAPNAPPAFSFIPTYDIDIAYKYLYKPLYKNIAWLLHDFFSGKWASLSTRIKVLRRKIPDPFLQFDYLDKLHATYQLQPVYFFLLAGKQNRYDKNITPFHPAFRKLINRVATQNKTGLHPSWQSSLSTELLAEEIATLQKITGSKPVASRQHYIRMELPATYRSLIKHGMKEDYSMGYGSINGFRASTSNPFLWYDLEKETTTDLYIHPFCFMDANAIFEQKQTPAETLSELIHYSKITAATHGQMLGIWHNHFLTDEPTWQDWKNIYARFLEKQFC